MTPEEAWELIEQDLIPSCREDARTEFYEMLANIWDEAYNAGFKDSKIWEETGDTPNPYRASETA